MKSGTRIAAICTGAVAMSVLLYLLFLGRRDFESVSPQRAVADTTPLDIQEDLSGELDREMRRIDSLNREIERTRSAIGASRHEMQALIDTLIAQNRLLRSQLDECRGAPCVESDSLRRLLEAAEARGRECRKKEETALADADGSKALLSATQKELAKLQAIHTIRALFVLDSYVSSPASERDGALDRSGSKKAIVRYFDVCAVALGWKERYCDVSVIVYGVQNAEGFSALKRAAEKHRFTSESLYFLARLEYPGPRLVDKAGLKGMVMRAFGDFESEERMGFRNFSSGMITPGLRTHIGEKMNALKAANAW